jgi:hypothetical protein
MEGGAVKEDEGRRRMKDGEGGGVIKYACA